MNYKKAKFINDFFGFSRQQLNYWRKVGLFEAENRDENGTFFYNFKDLKAIKTIRDLKDKGFSTYKIRKAFEAIKIRFPGIKNPFVSKPIIALGDRIAIIDDGRIYDAIEGQAVLIEFTGFELWLKEKEVAHLKGIQEIPSDWVEKMHIKGGK